MYRLLDRDENKYQISAQLFFDCYNGTDAAIEADEEIIISKWDAVTGDFLGDFRFRVFSESRVRKSQDYSCVNDKGDICVAAYLYNTTQIIDPGTNGVILSWQRCCRNLIIDNIKFPGASGFAGWTTIPPRNIINSSPFFSDIPPLYVCVDAPLDIIQDGFDLDGDSLAYKLVTPFMAGAPEPREKIRPESVQWYESPSFREILWEDNYSKDDPIPGDPELVYNSETGRLTVTPTEKGQYVIGLLIEEFRNGIKIGETRRDYQINVIACDFNILANYKLDGGTARQGIYSFSCSDTVTFINKSIVKSSIDAVFFWDFGVPDITSDTLTTFDINEVVQYKYPGNGNYTISLTVKSNICEDEYNYDVKIRSSPPFDLGPDKAYCKDFNLTLETPDPDAPEILWNTGAQTASITVKDTGLYKTTVSYGECSYTDSVYIGQNMIPDFSIPDDSLFCDDVDMLIMVDIENPPSDLKYFWTIGSIDSDTGRSVRVTEPGIYSVTLSNGDCSASDDIRIWTSTKPKIPNAFYCNSFIHVAETDPIEEATYLWSNGNTGQQSTYTMRGTHWLDVFQRHCENRVEFVIGVSVITLDIGEDTLFCDSLSYELDAGPNVETYLWNNGQKTRKIEVVSPGQYFVSVVDSSGCTKEDTITISLSQSPAFELGPDTIICVNDPLNLAGPEGYNYLWSTSETSRVIRILDQGDYILQIWDEDNCSATDTIGVTVDPDALPNNLWIPNSFTPNDDQLNDYFPFSYPIFQPEYQLMIFTRWGEKIFDSNESDSQSWDGTYKGSKSNQAAFIYQLYYKGCDGRARNQSGTVTPVY